MCFFIMTIGYEDIGINSCHDERKKKILTLNYVNYQDTVGQPCKIDIL